MTEFPFFMVYYEYRRKIRPAIVDYRTDNFLLIAMIGWTAFGAPSYRGVQ
jgi:hypothetical protein